MAALPAERTANPVVVIRQTLDRMAPEFKAALPAHVSEEKFRRVAMTAIQNNPDLQAQDTDKRSLFGALVRLAQDGLLPDGREAALVIFNTKSGNGWVKKVQAMPMIAGVLKKVRQSGEVSKVSAYVVHERDHFVVKYGFDEDVEHVPPALNEPRGKPIGAYATAVLKDGSHLLEVMSYEEIEAVRGVSRSKDKGPWVQWWGEMARKTVMRRLSKRLPMSTDLEEGIFQRDATMTPQPAFEPKVIDNDAPEPTSRLDALEQHIEGETIEDAELDDDFTENPNADHGARFDDTPEGEAEASETIAQVEGSLADQLRAEIAAAEDNETLADVQQRFADSKPQLKGTDITDIRSKLAERRNRLADD